MCRVSVIIPTYKRAERLTNAIDSVINQSFDELEIIVIDDNDPETQYRNNTQEIMKKYEGNRKVKYIKHEKNKNGAAARNTGIRNSNSEYIAFLDDDDFFYYDKIRQQVMFLDNNPEYEGVYTGRIQNGNAIYATISGDLSKEILLETFSPTTCALMFRREALLSIDCFDESFKRHQDYELLLRFFKKGYKLGTIKEPLVEIGRGDGGNELHGADLENNKKHYLKQFHKEINRLNEQFPGFKNDVYVVTFRFIFFDHLSQKNFSRALYIYRLGLKRGFVKFNKEIIRYGVSYIKIKLKRKLKKEGV